MNFELSDSVFAKANFKNIKSVNLWLGAHVMVEYSLEEAKNVLEASLCNCETNLETMGSKLEQVKDSVTITEVCSCVLMQCQACIVCPLHTKKSMLSCVCVSAYLGQHS